MKFITTLNKFGNMKLLKIFSVAAFCAMTISANAAITATAVIKVTSAGGGYDELTLIEATDGVDAFESGKDAIKIKNSANDYSINLYAKNNSEDLLSTVYTNNLDDISIVFESNKNETDYTFTFTDVTGTVKLYDSNTNTLIVLTENGTYNFTAPANSVIEGRFQEGEPSTPLPGEPKICFKNEKLIITDALNPIVVKGADEGMTYDQTFPATTTEIDMSAEAAGHYTVVFEGETMIFNVKPQVTEVTNP